MAQSNYYKHCALRGGEHGPCLGNIEWHHNLIYAGRQVNRSFCILPVCHGHHLIANRPDIKEALNRIMVFRASPFELMEFSKVVDYQKYRNLVPSDSGIVYPFKDDIIIRDLSKIV